jgi:hypothetical protein
MHKYAYLILTTSYTLPEMKKMGFTIDAVYTSEELAKKHLESELKGNTDETPESEYVATYRHSGKLFVTQIQVRVLRDYFQ